jgi:hypothetical protein
LAGFRVSTPAALAKGADGGGFARAYDGRAERVVEQINAGVDALDAFSAG